MIFLNSASSAAALVFYLPGVYTQTDTEGKQRKARVRNILKYSEKTQYLMNTKYVWTALILDPSLSLTFLFMQLTNEYHRHQNEVGLLLTTLAVS